MKKDRKIVKFCAAFGLAVMLAVGASPRQAAAKQAEPVQTELDRRGDGPDLVITNAREMLEFATKVNNGNSYSGQLVVLGADIAFDGVSMNNYTPANGFAGTFDGQGHSISGIKVTRNGDAALFSYSSGVIKNVTLTGCEFQSTYKYQSAYVGLVGENDGTINNCTVINTQFKSSADCTGGIAGRNVGTIQNCYVGTGSNGQVLGGKYVGGIVGVNVKGANIYNCVNSCKVISDGPSSGRNAYLGGIAGDSGGGNIENCYNNGTIDQQYDNSYYIGGIVGYVNDGIVYHCYTLDTAAPRNFEAMNGTGEGDCKAYTAAEMQAPTFLNLLNTNRGAHNEWSQWEMRPNESAYPLLKTPISLENCIIAPIADCPYTGKEQTPPVTITCGGYTLVKDVDYTVTYSDNTKIGTATVTISGIGAYMGTIKKNFKIDKPEQTLSYKASFVKAFSKSGFNLNVSRTKGDGTLTYSSSNTKVVSVNSYGYVTMNGVGKAQITVTAGETSNYKATSVKISITVKPAKVKLTSVQVKGGRILAKWNKASHVTGYQIQYSTSKKFKSGVKQATIKKTKVSYKSKKIKKGKTYYVRVRAYKGNLYGAWSTKKKVKR